MTREELLRLQNAAQEQCLSAYRQAMTCHYGGARGHSQTNPEVHNAGHHASVYLAITAMLAAAEETQNDA